MCNDVINVIVIFGDLSHHITDELYNKYSKFDSQIVQEVKKIITKKGEYYSIIKIYSGWNPLYTELVDVSLKYNVWIKNTFTIESGACGQGVIVLDKGEIIAHARYYDHEQDTT